jgi:hypothetical protein
MAYVSDSEIVFGVNRPEGVEGSEGVEGPK